MKKLSYLSAIICVLCALSIPASGTAQPVLMSDSELDQITAQAGFSHMMGILQVNHDEKTGSYYFGGENGGYLSFADISYDGSFDLDPTVSTRVFEHNGATGIECVLDGPVIDISNFSTTIRLGTEVASGASLGTLHIGHLFVDVHGTMRVTTK